MPKGSVSSRALNKLLIGLPLLAALSCSRARLSPASVFREVSRQVKERSGFSICQRSGREELDPAVEEILRRELSLEDAVSLALLNNGHLQAVYQSLGVAQAELVQAGLLKNPLFDLSFKYHEGFGSRKIVELGGVQSLLDLLLTPLKRRRASAELEIAKSQIVGEAIALIAEVKTAFFSLQAEEEVLGMKRELLEAAEAACQGAERLREAGNITELALILERLLYEEARAELSAFETSVVQAREKLNSLMGLWGCQTFWSISKGLPPIPQEEPLVEAVESYVVASSLDLKLLRSRMAERAAQMGVKISESLFPEFLVGVASEREADGSWFTGPRAAFALPLFDFGQAQRAAGYAELRRLREEQRALAVDLRSKARLIHFKLWNAHRQSRLFEERLLPLSKEALEQTLLQVHAMQLGFFELLAVKQRQIELEMRSVRAARDYWIACAELEQLISGKM